MCLFYRQKRHKQSGCGGDTQKAATTLELTPDAMVTQEITADITPKQFVEKVTEFSTICQMKMKMKFFTP